MTPFGRLNAIRDLRCLPCAPKAVLLALALRCDEAGTCFPSVPTVAGDAGLSRSTTIEAISRLEREGWIAVERVPGRVSRVRIVDGVLADPSTRPIPGQVPVQSPDTHPSDSRTGTSPIAGQGGPTAGRGCPITGHEQYTQETKEQGRPAPPPSAEPEPTPTDSRAPVIEPAELDRLCELYESAMVARLGRAWAVPRGQRWTVAALAGVYGGRTRAERLAWIGGAVVRFVDALEQTDPIGFGAGFPRAFERWLAAGSPAGGYQRAGPRGAPPIAPPPYHQEWRPEDP